MTPENPSKDEVALCPSCNTMKHLRPNGLCGRCDNPSKAEVAELLDAFGGQIADITEEGGNDEHWDFQRDVTAQRILDLFVPYLAAAERRGAEKAVKEVLEVKPVTPDQAIERWESRINNILEDFQTVPADDGGEP